MNTVSDFLRDLQGRDKPSDALPVHLRALWWAQKGDWDTAHDLAQDAASQSGDWVHAYLHRVEGDLGNAAYWYRRANQPVKARESLEEEWKELVTFFLESLQGRGEG
mgnify:FL=1